MGPNLTGALTKRGSVDTGTHPRGEHGVKTGSVVPQPGNYWKAGERPEADPPLEPSAGAWPHQHLHFILFSSVHLAALGLRSSTWALHHAARVSLAVVPGLSRSEACGILVPQPGITPASPALEGGLLTTGPAGESPSTLILDFQPPEL